MDDIVFSVETQANTGATELLQSGCHLKAALISLNGLKSVIILHSRRLPNSDIPRFSEGDISLDQIPDITNAQLQEVLNASTAASSASLLPGVCLVRPRRLSDEAERLLTGLLELPIRGAVATNAVSPISCSLLEHVMDTLVNVARQRPQFMDRIVQSFETVHVTLPPHFSDVQVSSVRKKLKQGLLQLLRGSTAVAEFQGRITILLTDLGATQNEVFEALHRTSDYPLTRDPPAGFEATLTHGDVDMRQMRSDTAPKTSTTTTSSTGSTPSRSRLPTTQTCTAPGPAQPHLPSTASSESTDRGKSFTETKASAGNVTVKPELPSIDLITTRLVRRLTTANVADLVLLRSLLLANGSGQSGIGPCKRRVPLLKDLTV
ncbi:unnamed protein product [Echinostoma caproni]|uniref:DUF3453 domain-containing protein n=1 Tax=Echinostoma caproni TaxID=27848 RepID=A0A183B284_9TREM|nr:unnamed protein product [Echinostoma caproni]